MPRCSPANLFLHNAAGRVSQAQCAVVTGFISPANPIYKLGLIPRQVLGNRGWPGTCQPPAQGEQGPSVGCSSPWRKPQLKQLLQLLLGFVPCRSSLPLQSQPYSRHWEFYRNAILWEFIPYCAVIQAGATRSFISFIHVSCLAIRIAGISLEILWLLQQQSPQIDSVVARFFYGITWFVALILVEWWRSIKDVSGWGFFGKSERA